MNDNLGQVIPGSCFRPEKEDTGRKIQAGIMQKATVKGEQMQEIEMLALVFVQAFDLRIEEGIGINAHVDFILNHLRQNDLVLALDGHEFFLKGRIVGNFLQSAKQAQIGNPFLAHHRSDQLGKLGVATQQPTPG